MKQELINITLSNEIFKKLKKHKKVIYVTNSTKELESLENFSKVSIRYDKNTKSITRIIKKIYKDEELKNLPKDKKYIYYDNTGEDNLIGIEFKYKKRIIRKIILILFIIGCILGISYFGKIIIRNYEEKKIKSNLSELKKDSASYLIVEINPKAILEIKNNIVTNIGCLNEDCKNIMHNLEMNKPISETINTMIKTASDAGINTSNVLVSSSKDSILEEVTLKNVKKEKIEEAKENELINNILDNESIKDNKESYNESLLDTYKKDGAYNKLYTCSINNNNVECYLTDKLWNKLSRQVTITNIYSWLDSQRDLMSILDKFGVEYKIARTIEGFEEIVSYVQSIKVNNKHLNFGISWSVSSASTDGIDTSWEYNKAAVSFTSFDPFQYNIIPLNKINLINGTYKVDDMIIKN